MSEQLARFFDILQLETVIITALHYQPTIKDKANFVEALFGGLFISKGYSACKTLWLKMNQNLDLPRPTTLHEEGVPPKIRERKDEILRLYRDLEIISKDPISTLQELCLKNKRNLPKYKILQRRGPDHRPNYKYQVTVIPFPSILNEEIHAEGSGSSKQKAKFAAAAKLCDMIYLSYSLF